MHTTVPLAIILCCQNEESQEQNFIHKCNFSITDRWRQPQRRLTAPEWWWRCGWDWTGPPTTPPAACQHCSQPSGYSVSNLSTSAKDTLCTPLSEQSFPVWLYDTCCWPWPTNIFTGKLKVILYDKHPSCNDKHPSCKSITCIFSAQNRHHRCGKRKKCFGLF